LCNSAYSTSVYNKCELYPNPTALLIERGANGLQDGDDRKSLSPRHRRGPSLEKGDYGVKEPVEKDGIAERELCDVARGCDRHFKGLRGDAVDGQVRGSPVAPPQVDPHEVISARGPDASDFGAEGADDGLDDMDAVDVPIVWPPHFQIDGLACEIAPEKRAELRSIPESGGREDKRPV